MKKMTFKQLCAGLAMAASLIACSQISRSDVTIYTAEAVITMNESFDIVEAVAVKDGKIIALGSRHDVSNVYPNALVNVRFDDQVIMPGFIDPHIHMTLGAMMYALPFAPPWDMPVKDGWVTGVPEREAFLSRIADIEANSAPGPIIIYGYHNLIQGDITREDLDKISSKRPLIIWHYSGHDFYLNSAAIDMAKLTPELANSYHGVDLYPDGELTGRIYEDAALAIFPILSPIIMDPENIKRGWNVYETLFQRAGITTAAELGYGIFTRTYEDANIEKYYDNSDAYRLYLVPEHRAFYKEFGNDTVVQIKKLVNKANKNRRAQILPQIKLFTDAAFYSQTMRLKAPGYVGGQSQGTSGLWVTEEEQLSAIMQTYWDAGLDIRIHSNGDAAQSATLNAFSSLSKAPNTSQRMVIEHAGLIRPEQLNRMSKLGIGLSAASHYVHYMGEDYEAAIGERVKHITPLRSAFDLGMRVTLHSDAPLAPPEPLRAASVHVTRATRQGNISTPSERISKQQALKTITIDAAWALGLEDEIGSIDIGKKADFTILAENPLNIPAQTWPDIEVITTMIDGNIHEN